MPGHQGMALFERTRRIRRCGLIGGTVSLEVDVEASKPMPGPESVSVFFSVSVSLCGSGCSS